jgi:cystathionine beta-synthase
MNVLNAIGNTPLVKVYFDTDATVLAKLEYLNPGGSIKDRSALFMIEHAEKHGQLRPGGTIIEASSGNQGIAVAMIGAIKNYNVIITVSEKISKEKMDAISAYGAQIIICPAKSFIEDPDHYATKAATLHKNTPNSIFINQYFNPLNSQAHYSWLGPEIWHQTQGRITHYLAAAGSGGTVSGVGRYLKEQNPAIKVVAMDSNTSFRATKGNPKPYKVEGMGVDWVSPVLDYSVIDEFIEVSDDNALGMLKTMAHQHGLLIGPSSGAVAYAASQYVKGLGKGALAVMVFGDSGRAYLTRGFYAKEHDLAKTSSVSANALKTPPHYTN